MSRYHLRISLAIPVLAMLALGLVRPARAQVLNYNPSMLIPGMNRLIPNPTNFSSSTYLFNIKIPPQASSITFTVEPTSTFTYTVQFLIPPSEGTVGQQVISCVKTPFQFVPATKASQFSSQSTTAGATSEQYLCPVPANQRITFSFQTATANATGTLYAFIGTALPYNDLTANTTDPCNPSSTIQKLSVIISETVSTQLVSTAGTANIYVCGYSFTISGSATATAQFTSGTGAACATGTTNITGTYLGNTNGPLIVNGPTDGYVFKVLNGLNLCLAVGGTTPSAQGVLTYVQQ
jgi:hypothetical protein